MRYNGSVLDESSCEGHTIRMERVVVTEIHISRVHGRVKYVVVLRVAVHFDSSPLHIVRSSFNVEVCHFSKIQVQRHKSPILRTYGAYSVSDSKSVGYLRQILTYGGILRAMTCVEQSHGYTVSEALIFGRFYI